MKIKPMKSFRFPLFHAFSWQAIGTIKLRKKHELDTIPDLLSGDRQSLAVCIKSGYFTAYRLNQLRVMFPGRFTRLCVGEDVNAGCNLNPGAEGKSYTASMGDSYIAVALTRAKKNKTVWAFLMMEPSAILKVKP